MSGELFICLLYKRCKQYGCSHIAPHERRIGACGARKCEGALDKMTICIPYEDESDEQIISIWGD